jgi:hypothetical protein
MGKQARWKRERQAVKQARQKWAGKVVQFDLGQGDSVQLARVTSISDEGDVVVECLAGYDRRVPGLVMSLGYVDQVLTLVDAE